MRLYVVLCEAGSARLAGRAETIYGYLLQLFSFRAGFTRSAERSVLTYVHLELGGRPTYSDRARGWLSSSLAPSPSMQWLLGRRKGFRSDRRRAAADVRSTNGKYVAPAGFLPTSYLDLSLLAIAIRKKLIRRSWVVRRCCMPQDGSSRPH